MPNNTSTLNQRVVNGMQLLPVEDQAFCKDLHHKYTVVYRNLQALAAHSKHICDRLPDSQMTDYGHPFYSYNHSMRDDAINQHRQLESLNKAFADKLMAYFREKYRYNFYCIDIVENGSYLCVEKLHALTANIIDQKGTGLEELGKYLLRHQIRFALREEDCTLKLRKDTIIFSWLFKCVKRRGSNSYLLYDKERLTILLRLLSISHGGPFVLAKDEIALIDSLYCLNQVRFDVTYEAFGRYRLRFYRNARFNLSFPNAQSAVNFMDMLKDENEIAPVPKY